MRALVKDRDGALWIGANGESLTRWHDGRSTRIGRAEELPHRRVWSLHVDADNVLWIGTAGGGLCRYRKGAFAQWATWDGLPDD